MKKFKFNLESVLRYREHVEDNEKKILTAMHHELNRLTVELNKFKEDYKNEKEDFENKTRAGMTIQKAVEQKIIIKSIENEIETKMTEIAAQNKKIQKQTQVVIAATRERKILNKLRERKYKSYVAESEKENEKFVEEFVAYSSAVGK